MCKRFSDPAASHDRWTPVDIMEMHANKFPGYLMIEQTNGNDHARRLLAYYGGIRNLENMRRLIDEMAQRGIVSEANGAKPREVLITREQANAMFED